MEMSFPDRDEIFLLMEDMFAACGANALASRSRGRSPT